MPSKLLEEIKQTRPFARPSDEALVSIMRTASILEHGSNEILREFGITQTQYNVLRILRGAGTGGLCGKAIAERLVSRVPDVSRLLDRMDDAGLIAKKRDASDRRHVTITVTAKGKRVLDDSTPKLSEFGRERVGKLSSRTVEALVEALATIREGA
jgi:DNA-binding MarR family transcriptional regulator